MRASILWIEDGAYLEVSSLVAPVIGSGEYDISFALDASEALQKLRERPFDVVIADIRIPPGDDPAWIALYRRSGMDKVLARLGLQLLYALLKPDEAEIEVGPIPDWISPSRFGVLTVESEREVADELAAMDVKAFSQKTAELPLSALLDLIEEVLKSADTERE